jgi:hypothetical protein
MKDINSTTPSGFAYSITVRLQGHKNQYFVAKGEKIRDGVVTNSFFHTGKDLNYVKRMVAKY